MVIMDRVIETLLGGLTLDPTGMHCPSWDDAFVSTLWFKKNAPTLADYIFSKLFANDHKSCLVVKFSTSPHICCHCTL